MTDDQAVALSLARTLSRVGLTERLKNDDPTLLELADTHLTELPAMRRLSTSAGIEVLPWTAASFPPLLLATPDCPPALWYRGNLAVLGAPCVAIVGSRVATAGALEIASTIAADLATLGVVVISGLARGVDSAAHRGALQQGTTIAVLGSGLDRIYPAEHARLADQIATAGLVLSEYPPGTPPLPFHFPQRNRLISGLSRAVVVIEAAENSGSLITAACALEQGREVMAVPGNVLSGRNRGGHALIRDGAKIVERADDIVGELGLGAGSPTSGPADQARGQVPRDPVALAMEEGEPYDLDALTAALGMSGPVVLARLLQLEILGIVRRAGGGRFIRPGRTC
ncbi:MAG: DNA-processing protein DprA [Vicinamibacterales bacterium]